jgi:hypothetical protein
LSTTRCINEQPSTVWSEAFAHAAAVSAPDKQFGGGKGDAIGHGIQAVVEPAPGETFLFWN